MPPSRPPRSIHRVGVYCGASTGHDPRFAAGAAALGRAIARRGWELVYGGGGIGLMGAVADAALEAGGRAIGVIPHQLVAREQGHRGAVELRFVRTMHERKAQMASLADAFVALPGGYGTLEELFETITWGQLGIHRKPCAVLNVEGYFDPLLAMLDRGVTEGFIRPEFRAFLFDDRDPERLLDRLLTHAVPEAAEWIELDES